MTRLPLAIQKMYNKKYISTLPFDIQRSKNTLQVFHESRDGDTNYSLVLFAILLTFIL
jgi:hypothetical protein